MDNLNTHKVVRVHTTRDPFFRSIDHPTSILLLCSSRSQAGHVWTGKGLRDGQTNNLFPIENFLNHLRSQGFICKVENGGKTDDHTGIKTVAIASSATANEFLVDDQLALNHHKPKNQKKKLHKISLEVVKFLSLDHAIKKRTPV